MITVSVQHRGRRGYSLFWRDLDGVGKSTWIGDTDRDLAWKEAGKLEVALNGGGQPAGVRVRITWEDFRERLRVGKLGALKVRTQKAYETALNAFARIVHPEYLDEIDTSTVCRFAAWCPVARESVRSYLRHLQAALNWARRMKLIETVPDFEYPRSSDTAKGRPLTEVEFRKLLSVVPQVRKRSRDAPLWTRLLWGLWFSGLRISEAFALEWNSPSANLSLETTREDYVIIYREHKSSRQVILPVLPDFRTWLDTEYPENQRNGSVFRIPVSIDRTKDILSDIGTASGIIVSMTSHRGGGIKYASAHDIRRSFGARWAALLPEAVLATIMRHSSIETTRKYYAILEAGRILQAVKDALRGKSPDTQ